MRTQIAGSLKASDWQKFRPTLIPGGDPLPWQNAFSDYFEQRLALRYLNPIALLQTHDTLRGEGFSIVAIQCTLIEFLASASKGTTYRYVRRNDPPLGRYEYSDSRKLFTEFLATNEPFRRHFDMPTAQEFYVNVRCGLLHEAQTKNGWTIWARSWDSRPVRAATKRVYRDNLQSELIGFLKQYGKRLQVERSLQEAFIRKFDGLCA